LVKQVVVLEMADPVSNADDAQIGAPATLDIGGTQYNATIKMVMRAAEEEQEPFPQTLTVTGGSLNVNPA